MRIDKFLAECGLVRSRETAQRLIREGNVMADGKVVPKPSYEVNPDTPPQIALQDSLKYVSRGGLKLEGAINAFSLNVSGCHGIDIGASTGGFTDCLLQHGAVSVTAVDVGRSQLDGKLAADSRVTSYEGVNARYVRPEDIGGRGDIVVCDVSFISLELILPSLRGLLKEDGRLVTLIKPQFEVGRAGIGKGGIVKDRAAQETAVYNVIDVAADCGLLLTGFAVSPIEGGDGNREYLALFAPVDVSGKETVMGNAVMRYSKIAPTESSVDDRQIRKAVWS